MEEVLTKEKFIEAGKREFLEKGFKEASLRQICKKLGLTLGAFYGYFNSKEDLFASIVAKPANELLEIYASYHKSYLSQEPQIQKERIGDASIQTLNSMIHYMYQYYDEFKLIFCRSFGTEYDSYLEKLISLEVDSTRIFLELMKENNYFSPDIDDQLSHNLATMFFRGIVEIFEHDMNYEYAVSYVNKLMLFYTAGWMRLFES